MRLITAFIDEIGDLDGQLQIRFLDVIEERRVRPVGSNSFVPVNARFVFATHRDLEERIEQDLFREDLYARINKLVIELPHSVTAKPTYRS